MQNRSSRHQQKKVAKRSHSEYRNEGAPRHIMLFQKESVTMKTRIARWSLIDD